jgi:adenylosuccinate lyase
MIERYTLPEMGRIWSEENKFAKWLEVEIAVCDAQAELGLIPVDAVTKIKNKASFSIERINEIEETTHHDVIAFLTNVAETVGEESRYIHLGMTSSDLLDTALACLLKEAGGLILDKTRKLESVLRTKIREHRGTVMIGRTHGIHAEPITFGFKLAVWLEELRRRREDVEAGLESVSCGKISGAVGTYAHIDPRVEQLVMRKLGLTPAPISTQIVQRDRHAEFLASLAVLASSLEKIATEIRNLQRTDLLEVEECFREGQKGSSAMPHKRNPITCERICGLARIVRADSLAAMENVVLWHERDISHSSVERVILPDSTIAVDYMLSKLTWVIENLIVYPENMKKNMEKTNGLIFSQRLLLALTGAGMLREDAYRLVQQAAMDTWKTEKPFADAVREREEITGKLGEKKLEEVFSLDAMLKEVDAVIDRVLARTS